MSRCEATRHKGIVGALLSGQRSGNTVQCNLEAGHDGKHHGVYQMFAGFEPEHLWWEEPADACS